MQNEKFFQFEELNKKFSIVALFSLKKSRNMRIKKNFNSFIKNLSFSPEKVIIPQQVHSKRVGLVKRDSPSYYFGFDALVTREKKVALTVFTADCLSLFLYDCKYRAVGIIHAGWRGIKKGIIPNTLRAMHRYFHTEPNYLYVAFGPAIRKCCYEVGKEFKDFFPAHYIYQRDDALYFDLAGVSKDILLNSGVKKSHILDCGLCTFCSRDILFSYRREKASCARMVSLIMLL